MNSTVSKQVMAGALLFYVIPLGITWMPFTHHNHDDLNSWIRVVALSAIQILALVPGALLVAENPKRHTVLRLVGTQMLLAANIYSAVPDLVDEVYWYLPDYSEIYFHAMLGLGVVLTILSFSLTGSVKAAPCAAFAIVGTLFYAAGHYLILYSYWFSPFLIVMSLVGYLMVLGATGLNDVVAVSKFDDPI